MNMPANRNNCKCLICGKEFYAFPSVINNGGGKYCSIGCRNKHLNSREVKARLIKVRTCLNCGKEFHKHKYGVYQARSMYCSEYCYEESRVVNVDKVLTCKRCGEEYNSHSNHKCRVEYAYCSDPESIKELAQITGKGKKL